ncbi:MAG: NADH-dependent [FeFe] hydrogenase, group A6 [Clostridia bacterium]|jgi:NADH-quinone oxidoreductase subunit G/NADP-reducing hydrogenase subunit HndD|nr:NADH-dependent [FeFe] hydrogenase, group A6 [Clostridia bacterium]
MSHYIDPHADIHAKINNIPVTVKGGTTILEAAREVGIKIPTLCYHPDLPKQASCRICVVEVKGQRKFKTACNTPIEEGDEIFTNTKAVRDTRRTILELILANHPTDCLKCIRNTNCELQDFAHEYKITEMPFVLTAKPVPITSNNPSIVRDMAKCVKCGRCAEVCQSVQDVSAIDTAHRSDEFTVTTPYEKDLTETTCTFCGQCVAVCPVGALYEKDDTDQVWAALENKELHTVVQTAPAIRVALGEAFGLEPGAVTTGKMVAALRRLGFAKVFDTNFTADLTIIEEGNELLHRLKGHGKLPMITSCSPGWVNFIEKFYPRLLPHVSTCKSPQQMFGALAKTFYADRAGIPAEKIFSVSIMPCTAKKFEAARPEMRSSGYRDVDVVLTTRELARMIDLAGISFANLPEEDFDAPFGLTTGAAVIFGASGGVMEAALRTVYEVVTGQDLQDVEFKNVRGYTDIREAEVDLAGTKVKIAVASSLKNARVLLEQIKRGESPYHFIEIMACPGGCIGGGGQPYRATAALKSKRAAGIYEIDCCQPIRQSHKNPSIDEIYREFLGKPLGHKSHHLLHTHYTPRI